MNSTYLALSLGISKIALRPNKAQEPCCKLTATATLDIMEDEEDSNVVTCSSLKELSNNESCLLIDVSLVPNHYRFGSLYEFVGDVDSEVFKIVFIVMSLFAATSCCS